MAEGLDKNKTDSIRGDSLSIKELETMMVLAYLYLLYSKFDKALIIYRNLEVFFPQDYKIRLGIAYAELTLGHYQEALSAVESSFSPIMQPKEHAVACLLKGQALWGLEHNQEARLAIHQFTQLMQVVS